MTNEQDMLVFAALSDLSGKMRGKAFPLAEMESRLKKGIGWTPTNVMITCFDAIADGPFGALGDLVLIPDPAAGVTLDLDDTTERFMLGDVRELDGTPWALCTRSILKQAIARLERLTGLFITAAFEHEFQLLNGAPKPGEAYGLASFSARRRLGETLMAALRKAGMEPDTFMHEYGPDQFEVTIGPKDALRAADEGALLREITRIVAAAEGEQATFTPIRDPASVGNGVHIHLSMRDSGGKPATFDPDGVGGLSATASAFVAGILKHLPSTLALTAPSDISYLRLTPHRWSAAYNNLGLRDREASVRICPVTGKTPEAIARQFNFEYRAADAAASPHLALATLIHAGCQGIEDKLQASEPTGEDLSLLSKEALAERGLERLPQTLADALERFAADETVRSWFPDGFADVYVALKRGELAFLGERDTAERCALYEKTY